MSELTIADMTDVTLMSEDTYGGEDEEAEKAFCAVMNCGSVSSKKL